MKTPTRHYHVPLELQALDIEPDSFDEHYYLQESRWHRKNRIRQLKATIARQAEEIEHLRTALAIRTINDINENNIESLKFIQQHLTVETFQPHIEQKENHSWMFTWKRPIPRWNNSIIDLHLPEAEQP